METHESPEKQHDTTTAAPEASPARAEVGGHGPPLAGEVTGDVKLGLGDVTAADVVQALPAAAAYFAAEQETADVSLVYAELRGRALERDPSPDSDHDLAALQALSHPRLRRSLSEAFRRLWVSVAPVVALNEGEVPMPLPAWLLGTPVSHAARQVELLMRELAEAPWRLPAGPRWSDHGQYTDFEGVVLRVGRMVELADAAAGGLPGPVREAVRKVGAEIGALVDEFNNGPLAALEDVLHADGSGQDLARAVYHAAVTKTREQNPVRRYVAGARPFPGGPAQHALRRAYADVISAEWDRLAPVLVFAEVDGFDVYVPSYVFWAISRAANAMGELAEAPWAEGQADEDVDQQIASSAVESGMQLLARALNDFPAAAREAAREATDHAAAMRFGQAHEAVYHPLSEARYAGRAAAAPDGGVGAAAAHPKQHHAATWPRSADPRGFQVGSILAPWMGVDVAEAVRAGDPGSISWTYTNATLPLRVLLTRIGELHCEHGEDWLAESEMSDVNEPSGFLLLMLHQFKEVADNLHTFVLLERERREAERNAVKVGGVEVPITDVLTAPASDDDAPIAPERAAAIRALAAVQSAADPLLSAFGFTERSGSDMLHGTHRPGAAPNPAWNPAAGGAVWLIGYLVVGTLDGLRAGEFTAGAITDRVARQLRAAEGLIQGVQAGTAGWDDVPGEFAAWLASLRAAVLAALDDLEEAAEARALVRVCEGAGANADA